MSTRNSHHQHAARPDSADVSASTENASIKFAQYVLECGHTRDLPASTDDEITAGRAITPYRWCEHCTRWRIVLERHDPYDTSSNTNNESASATIWTARCRS
jgi:hypothetical protein